MKYFTKIIKVILAISFLLCLLNMPYGYYQLVRFIGMIGFGILSYNAFNKNDNFYFVLWGASAILINPLIKIVLGRDLWNIVDIIWAVILIITLFTENKKRKEI